VIYGFGAISAGEQAPDSATRSYRALILNVAFWTLFGLLQATTWLLAPIGRGADNPWPLVFVALFNAYIWALLTPFLFPLAARVARAHGRRLWYMAAIVPLGVAVAAVVAVLASSVHGGLPWQGDPTAAQMRFRFWALSRWYFQELVLFFLVFAAGVATDMVRTFRAREREAARLKAEATALEAERAELKARLADARLAVLRSQLNPHFLFNTLNAVSALVSKDPVGVRDMIALLSDLLRSALSEADDEIPVAREMELLRLYLEILEIRYQGELRTRLVVAHDARDALVPPMILQPLVENAMKHGVAPATGTGLIEIEAQRRGDDLLLTVRDSGGGGSQRSSTGDGNGVGLWLTRQRLAELYGEQQRLELVPADGGGMIARIVLPFHTRAELHRSADIAAS
jgi:two-component sensor histidine kinase